MEDLLEKLKFLGVRYVSVFAYSLENRKRSREEKAFLMKLALDKCARIKQHFVNGMNFRMKVCGRLWDMKHKELQKKFLLVMNESELRGGRDVIEQHFYPDWFYASTPCSARILAQNGVSPTECLDSSEINNSSTIPSNSQEERLRFNLCFAYTGTDDMNQAAYQLLVRGLASGILKESDITPLLFQRSQYTDHCPSPDLLIRTSGESRLSDFMNFQVGGSYLQFVEVMWPDFSVWHLMKVIMRYQKDYPALRLRQEVLEEQLQKLEDAANEDEKSKPDKNTAPSANGQCASDRQQRLRRYLRAIDDSVYALPPIFV